MPKSNLKIQILKDSQKEGIWKYFNYLHPLDEKHLISLGEGNTPVVEIEQNVFLKREDFNPTGSIKDRGMAYLISLAKQGNANNLVISSSGNAAISAAYYSKKGNLNLEIFVSKKINSKKLKELEKTEFRIHLSQRPITDSFRFSKANNFFHLRPSIHPLGPEGYQTIAFEILEDLGIIDDIFIPVSSGVGFLGIFKGFKKFGFIPRFHLCQSSYLCPLASLFDKNYVRDKENLTDSLVSKSLPLKGEIIKIIKQTKGNGWVINNKDLIKNNKFLEKKGIYTSMEGVLTFSSYLKARQNKFPLGKTVCLLTGKRYF